MHYSVQYVERHGRSGTADPWSVRKYAVNQQYDSILDTSTWILIQPRQAFKGWIHDVEHWHTMRGALEPLVQHIRFLKSASYAWRWYLNYLSDELQLIVRALLLWYMVLTVYVAH